VLRRVVLILTASLGGFGSVAAAAAPDAQFQWRLAFGGGQPVQPGYGLSVGYRGHDADFPAARLFALDVTHARAFARLAGLPLFDRSDRSDASDALDDDAAATEQPWYGRQWILWTVGGIAATASLIASAGGGSSEGSNEINIQTGGSCFNAGGGNILDDEIPETETCVPEDEIGCDDAASDCPGWTARSARAAPARDPEHDAWLDAGTGHMGDLPAR
jgi:hypothetical protein